MPTDTERREVARRLRMSRSEWSGMGWKLWLGPKFGAVVLSDGNRDELEDAARLLADLIEPSCDRERLLRLAGKVFEDTEEDMRAPGKSIPTFIAGRCLRDVARRIREACGEES